MAAGRVHTNGQIADQPDPHARIHRDLLRRGSRPIGYPLQELVKQNLF